MIWALIPTWLKYSLAALVVAFLLLSAGYLAVKREVRQQAITEQLREAIKSEKERSRTMQNYVGLRTMIFAFLVFAVAGCQSNNATSCAGWRQNNLSPAGLVALIKVDRPAAERVEGNDENGKRRGCWE